MSAAAAIVTGASSGIGRAIARALCARGYGVTIVARGADRLGQLAAELDPAPVHPIAADVADADAADDIVRAHIARFGRLDVAVANAGTGRPGSVAGTDAAQLRRMLAVNVEGAFALARASVPSLREAASEHRRAWFVVTASISGVTPTPGFAAYSASKAAVLSLARSVNREESASGVRACALCPGFADTEMTRWLENSLPGTEMIQPEDVATAVGFLLDLSPNAVIDEIVMRRRGAPEGAP